MIKLRNARQEDIPELLTLLEILTSLEESFDFNREAHTKGLALLIGEQPRTCVAVAEEDGHILGMCTGQTVISTATGGPSVWVEDVVVHPDNRRQGLGSRLLDFLGDWAETAGARRQQLLIDNDNAAALEFYKSEGWRSTNFSCLRKLSRQPTAGYHGQPHPGQRSDDQKREDPRDNETGEYRGKNPGLSH